MKKYDKYKESELGGINVIPNHWTVSFIKRGIEVLTDYEANGSFASVKENVFFTDDIGYAWYVRATDLEKKDFENYNSLRWVDEKTYNFLNKTRLVGGELLVAKRGEIGKVYLMPDVQQPTTLAPNLYLVRLNEKIIPKFGWYYFLSGIGQTNLKLKNRSTTMGALYKDDFKDIPFIYPPLQEQTTIASFLDHKTSQIDALIEKKEQLIEKLKLQRQAIINEAVTKGLNPNVPMKDSGIEWLGEIPEHWETCKIKHLAKLSSGDFISAENINEEGKYPVLGGNGLRGYTTNYNLKGYYVLIGRQGALCGNINYGKGDFWATEHAIVVTPIKELDTYYFGELLRFMNLNQYSESAAQPGIAVGKISNLIIPYIPYCEQRKISKYIESKMGLISNSLSKIIESIEKLKLHRQAIISEAVTGKIDVRDWEK